jgi:hypothetical protein
VGPHYPARPLNPYFWQLWLPHPELFDFDDVVWKERTTLGSLMSPTSRERDLGSLAGGDVGDNPLSVRDVDRFFDEFLPFVHADDHANWTKVGERWRALQQRYTPLELRRLERVAGRIATALDARMEGVVQRSKDAERTLSTHYDVACLSQYLLLLGRAEVETALANPEKAVARAAELTPEASLYLSAMFRLDRLVWEAHKMRFLDMILVRSSERFPGSERAVGERKLEDTAKKLWGVSKLSGFLREKFREPEYCDGTPEQYPEFVEGPGGEILPARPSGDVAHA